MDENKHLQNGFQDQKKTGKGSKSHRQGLHDDAAVAATSKDSCVQVVYNL